MADKKISDFTAVTAVADADLLEIETAAGNSRKVSRANLFAFRGALVKKAADQIGANYSTAAALAWDAEAYDTNAFHDNVTNNTRLTVPTGVTRARLWGHVRIINLVASEFALLSIFKNGIIDYDGSAVMASEINTTSQEITVSSPVLSVAALDYFELFLRVASDTAIDVIATRSSFAIEAVA